MSKNRIIIIDGKNLLWRNSDAFSELSVRIDGEDMSTGGMYGFISSLIRLHLKYRSRIFIAWEGENNFRFKLYPSYKNRDRKEPGQYELAEEVVRAEGYLEELLSYAGVRQYYGVKCEADDVIGTISERAKKKGINTIIYSADSDLRQLVCDTVTVVSPGRGNEVVYDEEAVIKKHSVTPEQIPLLKALAGDSSDNIPGLPGIGEKTASALINEYGNIDLINSYSCPTNTETDRWPVHERFRKIVWDGREQTKLFLKLTTIKRDVGLISVPVDQNKKEVIRLLKLYKFRSLSSAAELLEIMNLGR